ncbi:MAG: ammonium transporter [Deltaproteobacteria bacterium]|nr:ammonium transporter [Deltaproteobacteria bacterium]NIS78411.1 ammonium transporter [Deltaproteobacteria bacterium]
MRKLTRVLCAAMVLVPRLAWASDAIDKADTTFMLVCSALVLLMTPGLAMFYGGMVRSKNVLSTMMHSFILMGVATIIWVLVGYSVAFGPDIGGITGGLAHVGLRGIGIDPHPIYAGTIPALAFMVFQMMFAIITPALISGAVAERIKFSSFLVFIALWLVVVYSPLAHWVWGGGWIGSMGALDFAGGTVVHISSGVSALAAAIVLGKRRGFRTEIIAPHNLPVTLLGTGLLWFGWFGFNAGSALEISGLATNAFVVTHIAAASGALGWPLYEWILRGKPTALGAASGAVAGLVAITPAAGFVSPLSAIVIGLGAGIICYHGVNLKMRLGYDDSLDVVGIHGFGGAWGAIATGIFASSSVNPAGADGLIFGNGKLLLVQIVSVLATVVFAFTASFLLLKAIDAIWGLRVDDEQEVTGLDLSLHGERGYEF